jgi:hypothetical protein
MPEGINDNAIVPNPKIKNPLSLKDSMPISLCNVIYKVVDKCLANRMRPLLHDIIWEMQSVFIPGRMIIDNAIIAFECIHALQNGSKNAGKFCAYIIGSYESIWQSRIELFRGSFEEVWVCRGMDQLDPDLCANSVLCRQV